MELEVFFTIIQQTYSKLVISFMNFTSITLRDQKGSEIETTCMYLSLIPILYSFSFSP
jgi:hypothetical protein